MELRELTIKDIKGNPVFEELIKQEDKLCNGQFVVEGYLLNIEQGILTNDVWSETEIFPAVQGPGYHEYREKGVLTNVTEDKAARYLNGFSEKEFWENGKFITKEKNT